MGEGRFRNLQASDGPATLTCTRLIHAVPLRMASEVRRNVLVCAAFKTQIRIESRDELEVSKLLQRDHMKLETLERTALGRGPTCAHPKNEGELIAPDVNHPGATPNEDAEPAVDNAPLQRATDMPARTRRPMVMYGRRSVVARSANAASLSI